MVKETTFSPSIHCLTISPRHTRWEDSILWKYQGSEEVLDFSPSLLLIVISGSVKAPDASIGIFVPGKLWKYQSSFVCPRVSTEIG